MNALLGNQPDISGAVPQAPQNALAQGAPGASQILAPLVKQATDPISGEVNQNKLFVGLASNPATAQHAGEYLAQAVEQGATRVDVAVGALEKEFEKVRLIAQVARSLLPLGSNISQSDLINAVASPEFVRAVPDARLRAQLLVSAPRGGTQLAQWVALQAKGAQASLDSMLEVMQGLQAAGTRPPETPGAPIGAVAGGPPDPSTADLGELMSAPGWLGRAASRYLSANPQVLQGSRREEKVRVLREQLSALQRQESLARSHYNELAGGEPFASWWEDRLASKGLV